MFTPHCEREKVAERERERGEEEGGKGGRGRSARSILCFCFPPFLFGTDFSTVEICFLLSARVDTCTKFFICKFSRALTQNFCSDLSRKIRVRETKERGINRIFKFQFPARNYVTETFPLSFSLYALGFISTFAGSIKLVSVYRNPPTFESTAHIRNRTTYILYWKINFVFGIRFQRTRDASCRIKIYRDNIYFPTAPLLTKQIANLPHGRAHVLMSTPSAKGKHCDYCNLSFRLRVMQCILMIISRARGAHVEIVV